MEGWVERARARAREGGRQSERGKKWEWVCVCWKGKRERGCVRRVFVRCLSLAHTLTCSHNCFSLVRPHLFSLHSLSQTHNTTLVFLSQTHNANRWLNEDEITCTVTCEPNENVKYVIESSHPPSHLLYILLADMHISSINVSKWTHTHTHIYTHARAHIHTHEHTHTHTPVHVHTRTHTHAHTQTQIHTNPHKFTRHHSHVATN